MDKPRIFLGSSGQQEKLLQALTRGLEDVARVEPWTTSFNPGTTTLERLLELAHQVDFAAFVFAPDDWTTSHPAAASTGSGQAAPRDNVVFEAGLFGGVLGMRRTFILHANDTKLPSDLLGLTCVWYGATTPAEVRVVNQKLRKAIENEGREVDLMRELEEPLQCGGPRIERSGPGFYPRDVFKTARQRLQQLLLLSRRAEEDARFVHPIPSTL